jgi:hypothetical protein
LLETIDAALDEVAPLVGFPIVFDWRLAVGSRRDDGFNASLREVTPTLKISPYMIALR